MMRPLGSATDTGAMPPPSRNHRSPVFADTPWLDIPPSVEGQADLLARLVSIKPAALEAAMQGLQPLAPPSRAAAAIRGPALEGGAAVVDPRRFLQQVLNDETMALALRIEAAKALLHGPRQDD